MPRLLTPVLTTTEFDPAELAAIVLDGEGYRVADGVAPLDEVPGPLIRAAALVAQLPPRLIAEQHTAAWVWGAQQRPPLRLEVCSNISARTRPSLDSALSVREVVLEHDDTVQLGDLVVTTPLRTATDLARFVSEWTDDETRIVRELSRLGGFGIHDCVRLMNRRRNLPGKRVALERLAVGDWPG
jgi:hypothetical protein